MSRAKKLPASGRRRVAQPSFRRLNRNIDNSVRNKRRVLALLFTAAAVVAIVCLALALVPLFPELDFPGVELLR
ncbi:hypothetical protein ACFUCV_13155 [Specibacter sp. NPDC057265]|uniref:hypothetical protein n=1 Tax=Specibacter sp. NPDC057265 TaxID=3346075 RepID=UPI00363E4D0D